ncbi:MAG: putative portal protein [Prokaryotic dsDNA virus sp.]|nr:MAG: putative portal protein [Prokaryotic dsDNA virus sp.]|tara:strand:- start:20888 stop:23095 length:2208 start_codon:yes stop_codon:yes gene_type:complete
MDQDSKEKSSVIETAKKRYQIAVDYWSGQRSKTEELLEFIGGDQWPEEIKRQRDEDKRPCLTSNQIPKHVHQITNSQRQNRPRIKLTPFDNEGDIDTAKVKQGLIRSIENNSDGDTAYDVASFYQVATGLGWFRIKTDYCDPTSFDQEAMFETVNNPNAVLADPTFKKPDGSDIDWLLYVDEIAKEDYKQQYPDSEICDSNFDWDDTGTDWINKESVRVVEYLVREYKKETLIRLPDGSTALKKDLDKASDEELVEYGLSREIVEQLAKDKKTSRQTVIPKVKWYKLNGVEVLEETEWASKWIGFIPVLGETFWINDKRVLKGIVDDAKDPQILYNYIITNIAEAIGTTPKAPYIGAEGQFEGHETKWNSAHIKNYAYLEYKPTLLDNGTPAPPPQRNFAEPAIQAMTQLLMIAADNIKSATRQWDAALGAQSNEVSGKAINARTRQSETGNFHFIDNLEKSIRHGGRILDDVIPVIYDAARTVRITGEDEQQDIIAINQIFKNKDGKLVTYDFKGKYDVVVEVGPNHATQRQEAVESMLQLSQYYPRVPEVAGDLIVKNMDFPDSQEIAERLKKTIPPDITDENPQVPPEVQAQMNQMSQVVEQLTAQLDEANEKIKHDLVQIESKERIEMQKIEADLRQKEADLQFKYKELSVKEGQSLQEVTENLSVLASEIIEINDRMALLKFDTPINQDEIAESLELGLESDQLMPAQNINPTGGEAPGLSGDLPPQEEI